MSYGVLKTVHMTCAMASFGLFVVRGIWRFGDSPKAGQRWVKVVPHVIDTTLLATALTMAWTLAPFPAMHPFLLTKVLAVMGYILLGMLAFRWARTRREAITAWVAAQLLFFYIVCVAVTKSPSLTLL
jgi:uncharacterized membrane protein SirB2